MKRNAGSPRSARSWPLETVALTSMAAQIASLSERQSEADVLSDRLASTASGVQSDLASGQLEAAAERALEAVSGQIAREIEAAIAVAPETDRIRNLDPLIEQAQQRIQMRPPPPATKRAPCRTKLTASEMSTRRAPQKFSGCATPSVKHRRALLPMRRCSIVSRVASPPI